MKRSLTRDQVRALLHAAEVREGIPALAKRAGVAETTVRVALKSAEMPSDPILAALGVEHGHTYTLVLTGELPEMGRA